ncbi:MFS general substrate transporter [Mytilinidion resinicola]|uniref:MFS general substrate transporter n=1 Tax=Mytilinidion resinicola TaxID=574789 RepID=A0A6A6YJJ5_9PEZI|nr:MFS general substrate transporter [Mytilinidion resinicola]KAF2809022.1 MFS general substrate transporter [Mytilinidion resinicola]
MDDEALRAEEKALVRKIDLSLLPTIWLMYLLSYMDRTNIGNAKVAGMDVDLHLTSGQYSIPLVVFFITYVVFEIPSNLILSKTKPSIYLPVIMTLWGAVTCCMSLAHSYHTLLSLRLIVGVLEAGFAPGILLILSSWYKKDEQSKRFAVYISVAVLSGAFDGILAGAITGGLDGVRGLEGWRWLFITPQIVEGAATAFWAICSHFILLDFPANTARLTPREREFAISRLAADEVTSRTEDNPRLTSLQALAMSLSNWRTWLLTAGYMVIVGSSTLSYFYPTLVKELRYTSRIAQYIVVPIYAVAFVAVGVTGYFMDKHPQHRGVVIAAWLALSTLCSTLVCTIYNFTARYVFLVLTAAGLWASNGLALSHSASTFGSMSQEVRAVSLAFVNAMGNLAQIYSAYLFPKEDASKYLLGFGVISGMCAFGVAVYAISHVVIRRYPSK